MKKFILTCFLLLWLFNLKSQNVGLLPRNSILGCTASTCHSISKIKSITDTLIVTPNPFDSITVIEFSIVNTDTIWLDLLNANGQTVVNLYNATFLASGSYTLNFNGDTLPNGLYFLRLKNNSTVIKIVKVVKISNPVGLKENFLKVNNLNVFPNPTASMLNIENAQIDLLNSPVMIKNTLGEIVLSEVFSPIINLTNLKSGIYFLSVKNETFKIIKQ